MGRPPPQFTPRTRPFGCEFEFSIEWKDLRDHLRKTLPKLYPGTKRPLLAREDWFRSSGNRQWHLKTDSSTLAELCTPVSTARDLPAICRVVQCVADMPCKRKITRNDSVHVHLDIRDIEAEKMLALWLKYEISIFGMFPAHRRNNTYCQRAVQSLPRPKKGLLVANYFKKTFEEASDHHYAISFFFYGVEGGIDEEKRGTVEIRVAEGTVDPRMARCWVLFLLHLAEAAKRTSVTDLLCSGISPVPVEQMLDELQVSDAEIVEWVEERAGKYGRRGVANLDNYHLPPVTGTGF